MADDRLERALREMSEDAVDTGTVEATGARVWQALTSGAGCSEFVPDFPVYVRGGLAESRRMLIEDHLSRCPGCRARIADMKGARTVVAMPQRASSRWRSWSAVAAAAAVLLAALYIGRDTLDAMLAPAGPRASVVSADGGLYRTTADALSAGTAIGEGEAVRTGPGAHAVLRLADGSMVDVNERTELYVTAAWSGQAIHLQRGDIIVTAAKQRRGHLRVLTRDSIASVKGTVFAVSAGMGGSVVSVVEGAVDVRQPRRQVLLSPGQQAASNPALASSVAVAVSWSPDAAAYLELLGSFVKIDRELAKFPTEMRTTSELLPRLPSGAVLYGSVPNPGLTIDRVLTLAEEQSAQNETFSAWWSSETGRQLRDLVDRVQSVSPSLGEEIAFSAAMGANELVPMVMARVKPGSRADLASALEKLFADAGEAAGSFAVSDDLVVVSSSPSNLAWALAHMGQAAQSPFAAAIQARYDRGVGWLVAIDAPPIVKATAAGDAPPVELAGMVGMKYLFVEQRAPAGAEENEVTLAFDGPRAGIGAWLADTGSGGAAEYLPAEALAAGYISTREPLQLFEELSAMIAKAGPDFERNVGTVEEKLGPGFIQHLTAALGTESAVALTGLSASGPTWVMAVMANDTVAIDGAVRTLVDTFNAELSPGEQQQRIVMAQETSGGRTWSTLTPGALPLSMVWTYDRGYMVMASDRGVAERALATRNGGSPLVWSPEFLNQLPSSAGLHPSAFAWLNTKGSLGLLAGLAGAPQLKGIADGDPMLVVFDGTSEQIHAASRTRVAGLVMRLMMLGTVGEGTSVRAVDAVPQH